VDIRNSVRKAVYDCGSKNHCLAVKSTAWWIERIGCVAEISARGYAVGKVPGHQNTMAWVIKKRWLGSSKNDDGHQKNDGLGHQKTMACVIKER
jgi:hypothetical protein